MEPETILKTGRHRKAIRVGNINYYIKMKKLFYTNLMVLMLLLSQSTKAQINLEHTFDEYMTWQGNFYYESSLYPSGCYYVATIINNSYNVKIYNADYSVNSNNTYNFTPPSGYKVLSVSRSQKTFNTDNNYEFLVRYEKTDYISHDNTNQNLILCNQNGTTIKDFGFANYIYVYPSLHIANNHLRLLVSKEYYNGNTTNQQVEIYSVPGEVPSGIKPTNISNSLSPFPNPASSTITLPYQLKQGEMSVMHIYNINGQLIETKQIGFDFDKILLNISSYAKGMYLYEVNGVSNRFIVE
ncbi:MAG: T9SS type A sorting domain-containing protein [Bacteroidales bacterium]|jgi:hypothetical protein|nr:T9SS type A sorting domain-containing protein [Bacteroidales bacterium]